MPFVLTSVLLGRQPELDLTRAEFDAIVEAKRGLFASLWVEEKFGVLLENYVDFEKTLLEQSLREAVFREHQHCAFQDRLYDTARHLANFLSSCRSYLDQAHGDLGKVYRGDVDKQSEIRATFRAEYDARFGYRTMEAVRNHSQHRSLPLHGLRLDHTRVDSAKPPRRIMSVPQLDVETLAEDAKFKASVLAELKSRGERLLDVRPLVREYVEGLAVAHGKVRELMASDVARWESTMAVQIARWREETGSSIIGLAAVHQNDDGEEGLEEGIFQEFMDRRLELVKRHEHAQFVSRAFVSNEERRE